MSTNTGGARDKSEDKKMTIMCGAGPTENEGVACRCFGSFVIKPNLTELEFAEAMRVIQNKEDKGYLFENKSPRQAKELEKKEAEKKEDETPISMSFGNLKTEDEKKKHQDFMDRLEEAEKAEKKTKKRKRFLESFKEVYLRDFDPAYDTDEWCPPSPAN